jgi:hypothetical protein
MPPTATILGACARASRISLPALIEAKERSGRPKDLAVLSVLRATLDETKRRP